MYCIFCGVVVYYSQNRKELAEMQTTDTLQYKRYTCQVFYYNVKDCLSGRVVGVGEIPNVRGQTLAEIKAEFHRVVDEYLLACEKAGRKPAQAFTGKYSIRTSPAIHEALAMYAMGQKMLLSQVIQQALNEFIKNHDIEMPNREEN